MRRLLFPVKLRSSSGHVLGVQFPLQCDGSKKNTGPCPAPPPIPGSTGPIPPEPGNTVGISGPRIMEPSRRLMRPLAADRADYLDAFVLACRETPGRVFPSADHRFDKTNRQRAWNTERKRVLGSGSRRVRAGESIAQAAARRP